MIRKPQLESGRRLFNSAARLGYKSYILCDSNVMTRDSMRNTRRKKKPLSAERIARVADSGKDVSQFFTNSGRMMKPIQRVNVDFTASMLEELELAAKELNISRQAVIKTLVRQGLDRRHVARASRTRAKRS